MLFVVGRKKAKSIIETCNVLLAKYNKANHVGFNIFLMWLLQIFACHIIFRRLVSVMKYVVFTVLMICRLQNLIIVLVNVQFNYSVKEL